jgi:hypothetical protein
MGSRDWVHGTRLVSWLSVVMFDPVGSCSAGGRRAKPSGGAEPGGSVECMSRSTMSVSWLGIGINDCAVSSSGGGGSARYSGARDPSDSSRTDGLLVLMSRCISSSSAEVI